MKLKKLIFFTFAASLLFSACIVDGGNNTEIEDDNTTEIVFDIPEIKYQNTVLIQARRFSFTEFFEDSPTIANMHHIYLTAVDFVMLGLLIKYAIKMFKEVFGKWY